MQEDRPRGRTNQKLRERVFNYYGTVGWLCGHEGADTIDHLVMISHGGSNDLENLRPAHGRKSEFCVGNFSRKRGKKALKPNRKENQLNTKKEDLPNSIDLVITYGEGWIKKQFRGITSTVFLDFAGLDIESKFVQDFISKP